MKWKAALIIFAAFGILGVVFAQQKGAPQPPLTACGASGDVEIICGTRAPEDLELTPDGKFLIVTLFGNNRGVAAENTGLSLFDPAKKTFTKMTITAEPLKDWGDASCPGPIGDALAGHGSSLVKRSNGKMQLFIVNHGGRESIEMYELKQAGGSWNLAWHGCVTTTLAFNDVAALADGGFVATKPTALQAPPTPQAKGDAKAKAPAPPAAPAQAAISGYVSRWAPGKGETELPGTRSAYPNGVVVSSDGRTAYIAVWRAMEVHKYDLRENKEIAMVKLDFMPDNLTWTKKNQLLAAGIKGAGGECPAGSGFPCIYGFGVAAIDPGKMTAKTVSDSGVRPLISGVSVALQMGDAVYIGAFQGDRLVKVNWKE